MNLMFTNKNTSSQPYEVSLKDNNSKKSIKIKILHH